MRAIVLGHRGFVGSAISAHLRAGGVDVLGIDRDNYEARRGAEAEFFINAAGSSDKRLAERDPTASLRANVRTAMDSLSDFRYGYYLLISSVDVYDDFGDPERSREGTAIDAIKLSPYGLIKYATELAVRAVANKWLIFRLGPLVGPGLRKNPVFDLVSRRTLFLDPESRLSFIDTRDVARIIWDLRGEAGEIFNVSGAGTVRLRDIATSLGLDLAALGKSLPVHMYSVDVTKIGSRIDVPSSERTVYRFLDEWRKRVSTDVGGA